MRSGEGDEYPFTGMDASFSLVEDMTDMTCADLLTRESAPVAVRRVSNERDYGVFVIKRGRNIDVEIKEVDDQSDLETRIPATAAKGRTWNELKELRLEYAATAQ